MFARLFFLAITFLCLSVCSEGNPLQPFSYLKNYQWSSSENSDGGKATSYSMTRDVENNDQGTKEVTTTVVVEPRKDGKPVAKTTTVTIQRDFDGKIISKKEKTSVEPASDAQQASVSSEGGAPQFKTKGECSLDDDCPAEKYCSAAELKCKDQLSEGEGCFRSRECANGAMCVQLQCHAVRRDGQTGSFCTNNKDCAAGHCCVAVEEAGECAYLQREGEPCGETGGFFSFNFFGSRLPSRCPCETGLSCEEGGGSWTFGALERTCKAKATKKSKTTHKKRKH